MDQFNNELTHISFGSCKHISGQGIQPTPFLQLLNTLRDNRTEQFSMLLSTIILSNDNINTLFRESIAYSRSDIAQLLMNKYNVKMDEEIIGFATEVSEEPEDMLNLLKTHPHFEVAFAHYKHSKS